MTATLIQQMIDRSFSIKPLRETPEADVGEPPNHVCYSGHGERQGRHSHHQLLTGLPIHDVLAACGDIGDIEFEGSQSTSALLAGPGQASALVLFVLGAGATRQQVCKFSIANPRHFDEWKRLRKVFENLDPEPEGYSKLLLPPRGKTLKLQTMTEAELWSAGMLQDASSLL